MNITMPMSDFEKKVNDIDWKVTSILTILKGNDLDKHDTGVLGGVNDLENRVANLEKWKDRLIWTTVGMSAPAAIGIFEILRKIFIK